MKAEVQRNASRGLMKEKASGGLKKVDRGYIGNEKKASKNNMGMSSMHIHPGIAQLLQVAED